MSTTCTGQVARLATGIHHLAVTLTRARFTAREGDGRLFASAIVAFTICQALALTVAGGSWMFYNRWQHPWGVFAQIVQIDPSLTIMGSLYFCFAMTACALLVPSMASLASAASVLGARGRERRLASLRLLGLSAADITRMSLMETVLQAVVGILAGSVVYLVTLPAWQAVSFIGDHIQWQEMLTPWWLTIVVSVCVCLIGVLASAWGLQRVRITPLGVARRSMPTALKWWRAVLFVIMVILVPALPTIAPELTRGDDAVSGFLLFAIVITAAWLGVSLVGPVILQAISGALAVVSPAPVMWAARRVQFDPRAVWKRAGGLAGLAFIGGFIAGTPLQWNTGGDAGDLVQACLKDFSTGANITLAIGFLLTATAIFIGQTSEVMERAEQAIALDKIGAPRSFIRAVAWWQVLGPVVTGLVLGGTMGWLCSLMLAGQAADFDLEPANPWVFLAVAGAGVASIVIAMVAVAPLQTRILDRQIRRND